MKRAEYLLKGFLNTIDRNSPTILTGLGVTGLVSTVLLTINGTVKAKNLIEQVEYEKLKDAAVEGYPYKEEKLSKKEIAKLVWKCYIPTLVMGSISIACIISSHNIASRRTAAIATLYSLADNALQEYKAKVIEQIGENKSRKVEEEIAQDKLNANPPDKQTVILTGKGTVLCYESLSGRYFRSSVEEIRKVQNDFNARVISDFYRPLNELYDDLGLEPIKMGEDIGWTTDCLLEVKFTSKITPDGEPCLVIEYRVEPRNI